MKRIISVMLSLALAAMMITPVFADDKITADEVKELMENTVLLSKQDYCDEILNMPVQNPEDIFENKKLSDYISADRTIIEEIQFTDSGEIKSVFMQSWDENNNLSSVSIDDSVHITKGNNVGVAVGASDTLNAHITGSTDKLGEWYPTSYLDYEKTAEILNSHGLKNITEIGFSAFAMGLSVTADGEKYWVTELYCMTPQEWRVWDGEQMAQQQAAIQTAVDKKRAVTPPQYQRWLDDETPEYDGEEIEYLAQYENSEPQFTDLGDDTLLINATAMLKDMGILSGYEDGTFRPDSTVTRGEASQILAKLVKGDYNTDFDFPDTKNHWSRDAVNYLTAANVIHGFEDGTFRPDTEITYGQAIILVYSIMGYNAFLDNEDKTLTLMRVGMFEGVDSFTPEQPISRGNFAKLIANAYDTEIMNAKADFRDIKPFFTWGYDRITLGMYLSGIEPVFGVFYVSREGYEDWENMMIEDFEAIYKNFEE